MSADFMPRIGLALGSGGARGWGHIGVLRALEAHGIRPDMLAGASMGALVGAFHASGALDALEDFARNLKPSGIARMLDISFGGGLLEGGEVMDTLRALGLRASIAELDRPYIAVATDIYRGREFWLREGDLPTAVRASIAIPGIFKPIRVHGRWLMDGGMSNPVPVSACRAMGADIVLAINPNAAHHAETGRRRRKRRKGMGARIPAEMIVRQLPKVFQPLAADRLRASEDADRDAPGYFEVLGTSLDAMIDQIRRSRLAGDPPDVMVNLDIADIHVLNFQEAAAAIAQGEAAMTARIDELRRTIEAFSQLEEAQAAEGGSQEAGRDAP